MTRDDIDDDNLLTLDFDESSMIVRYREKDEYNADDDPADMVDIIGS